MTTKTLLQELFDSKEFQDCVEACAESLFYQDLSSNGAVWYFLSPESKDVWREKAHKLVCKDVLTDLVRYL